MESGKDEVERENIKLIFLFTTFPFNPFPVFFPPCHMLDEIGIFVRMRYRVLYLPSGERGRSRI